MRQSSSYRVSALSTYIILACSARWTRAGAYTRPISCRNKHATGAHLATLTGARVHRHGAGARATVTRRRRPGRTARSLGSGKLGGRSVVPCSPLGGSTASPAFDGGAPACCLSLPFWLRRRPRGTRGCRRGAAAAMPGQLRRARSNERDGAPRSMLARSTPSPTLAGDVPEPCLLSLAAWSAKAARDFLDLAGMTPT